MWENDEVELVFPMKIRKIYANLKVREDAGCVAFMRGPMVYCFEGVDNPGLLQSYHIFEDAKMEEEVCKEGLLEGCVLLKIKARKLETVGDSLYSEVAPVRTLTTLTAVPYYTSVSYTHLDVYKRQSVICAGISFLVLAGLFIFQKKNTVGEFHKKLRM